MAGEFLADAIRAHIGEAAKHSPEAAILAVVEKCERMRAEATVGMHLANDMELLLIHELNAGIPYEHVDEFRRLNGL